MLERLRRRRQRHGAVRVPECIVEVVASRHRERSRASERCRLSGTVSPFDLCGERREQRFGVGDPAQSDQRLDLVARRGFRCRMTESRPGDQRLEDGMGGGYVT